MYLNHDIYCFDDLVESLYPQILDPFNAALKLSSLCFSLAYKGQLIA